MSTIPGLDMPTAIQPCLLSRSWKNTLSAGASGGGSVPTSNAAIVALVEACQL